MSTLERPVELEAMLLAARSRLDDAEQQRLRALVDQLNVGDLITRAAEQQVDPLVATTLLEHCGARLSTAEQADLTELVRIRMANNMSLAMHLGKILGWLNEAGVPALPYKGPTLAVVGYGDIGLRTFDDLDVLVPKERRSAAIEVLRTNGFEWIDPVAAPPMNLRRKKSAHAFGNGEVRIDLQWASSSLQGLGVELDETIWRSGGTADLLGQPVPMVPVDQLFVFICGHGARHCWDRLKWVCDVAELARNATGIDWEEVVRYSQRVGAVRVVHVGVLLATSLLGAEFPPHLSEAAAADESALELAEVARMRFLFPEGSTPPKPTEIARYMADGKERRAERLRFWTGFWFHPTLDDYDYCALPSWAWQLYRVVRPYRLVTRGLLP